MHRFEIEIIKLKGNLIRIWHFAQTSFCPLLELEKKSIELPFFFRVSNCSAVIIGRAADVLKSGSPISNVRTFRQAVSTSLILYTEDRKITVSFASAMNHIQEAISHPLIICPLLPLYIFALALGCLVC